jgi:hypothetical protein
VKDQFDVWRFNFPDFRAKIRDLLRLSVTD